MKARLRPGLVRRMFWPRLRSARVPFARRRRTRFAWRRVKVTRAVLAPPRVLSTRPRTTRFEPAWTERAALMRFSANFAPGAAAGAVAAARADAVGAAISRTSAATANAARAVLIR